MYKSEDVGKGMRTHKNIELRADLVVAGGGMSGVCCAITAARAGIHVVLVTDRPVLGGNASSEVRLWILGATSHMGNNNRWCREGGVIDEILIENLYRNPQGNTLILDTILLDKVSQEENITLLLNTAVYTLKMKDETIVDSLTAFCSINGTIYTMAAPLFCDATGDGIVGFMAGAAFRMGAEGRSEFGEKLAPAEPTADLLGHSMYFYSKRTSHPIQYVPPSFALRDIAKIPRYRDFKVGEDGCRLWWIEYGGQLDTIYDAEKIKWELWRVIYGVWDYIKNSGKFPDTENLTLEWVGTIPGKRESRRLEGDYILRQSDIVDQRTFEDAVAYGGWAIDLHPAEGVYSSLPGCTQWHTKGIYQIPYRSLYSKNIQNLFMAGRIISATHVAHGSTRVMATCALTGQAVGMAATICTERQILPAGLAAQSVMDDLQKRLQRIGHYIPRVPLRDAENLVNDATISASSEYLLQSLPFDGPMIPLIYSAAQMLPVKDQIPAFTFQYEATEDCDLVVELRTSLQPYNHTPEYCLEKLHVSLKKGGGAATLRFTRHTDSVQYVYICFMKDQRIALRGTTLRLTGMLSLFNSFNKAVSNTGRQEPPVDVGIDNFEFWCPQRRPGGHNIAFHLETALHCFAPENIAGHSLRPVTAPNAWVACPQDPLPAIQMSWQAPQTIKRIRVFTDTDYDHPLESSLMGHPESRIPYCVRDYDILDENGLLLGQARDNYQSVNEFVFTEPVVTKMVRIECRHPESGAPAALLQVCCYCC